jgi:hypothetical protein
MQGGDMYHKILIVLSISLISLMFGCASFGYITEKTEVYGWNNDGINVITYSKYDSSGFDYFGFNEKQINYRTKKHTDVLGNTRSFYGEKYSEYKPYKEIYIRKEQKQIPRTESTKVIQTGPRGGKYYINSKGNKVYIK